MDTPPNNDGRGRSRGKWALAGFLAVAAYFLWAEHRAHVQGLLPYLLLLACPLMHLLHHGGHHHGSHAHRHDRPDISPEDPS
jgi:hypothetical protein